MLSRYTEAMKKNNVIVIEWRAGMKPGQGVLHTMEACPERLALGKSNFDVVDPSPVELTVLKTKHGVCATCSDLEVASSADRVRFLLAGLASKKAS